MTDKGRWLRGTAYTGLALVLLFIFLTFTIPADWLSRAAERFSGGVIHIHTPEGTIWSGHGDLDVGGPGTKPEPLGKLEWHLHPLWLLVGRAQLALNLDGAVKANLKVRLSSGRYLINELSASLPAQLADLAYAPAAFFQPTGTIELHGTDLELTREGLNGRADATWRGAGGKFTDGTLGDYRISLNGNGATALLQLSTLSGRLGLEGQGKWDIAGTGDVQFNGSATPAPGAAAALEPLLRPIGADLGGGRRALRVNARLSTRQLGL